MRRTALALCAALALSAAASAGDLRPDRLPENTRWVAHLDLEAFSRTELWTAIQDQARREGHELPGTLDLAGIELDEDVPPEVVRRLRELHIDLFRDLKSITTFGIDSDVESSLAMLEMSSLVHDLLDIAREVPGYSRVEVDSIRMHRWRDPEGGNEEAYCYLQRVADDGTHVALFSTDHRKIAAAAQVLRGEARSMRPGQGSALKLSPGKGSFLYFECAHGMPGLHERGAESEIAGLVERVQLDVGERSGYLEARARVAAEDRDKTRHAANVLQGLTSLAALASDDEPEMRVLARLCNGLDFRTEGDELLIEFECDSTELVEMLAGIH